MNTIVKSNDAGYAPGRIDVRGAFLDDFEILSALPPHEAPAAIERDRPFFVANSGFHRKLLPLRLEGDGRLFSGGRYLFATFDQAAAFGRWLEHEFRLDGRLFVERPWAKDLTYAPYHVIGAHDFADVHDSQVVVRAERWAIDGDHSGALDSAWVALRNRAAASGLASVWLLFSEERREAVVITVAGRIGARDPSVPDTASLRGLENRPSLAEEFVNQSWARKSFDRTSWIFTIWFAPEHKPLHLWPNSPPLPGLAPAESL